MGHCLESILRSGSRWLGRESVALCVCEPHCATWLPVLQAREDALQ